LRLRAHDKGMHTTSDAVASALFASLLLVPGCFSADDAGIVSNEGSTTDAEQTTAESPDPSGDESEGTGGEDPDPSGDTGSEPPDDDDSGADDTANAESSSGADDTSGGESSGGETTGAPNAPTIVEILPEDGAVGVAADTSIVVRFSEPMDQASTQAAYQSSDIPAGAVTFGWNAAGDELTITPNDPLEYAAGTNPATLDALSYSFTLTSAGESEDGVALDGNTESSFSTLRRLTLEFEQDDEMSGRVRDLGGATLASTQYALGDTPINDTTRGYVTFDLATLPDGPATVEDANLHAEFGQVYGNPFVDLGVVLYQHVAYDSFEPALFDIDPVGVSSGLFGTINDDEVDRDVTEVAAEVLADPEGFQDRLQLRFLWVFNETDGDFDNDTVTMMASALRLDLQVLVP